MTFHDWVIKEAKKQKQSKTAFMRALAKKCSVSYPTLRLLERGGNISMYDKAKVISAATRGAVSVQELCE